MQNLFKGTCGKTLPKGLMWTEEPPQWIFDDTGRLVVQPKEGTDFYSSLSEPGIETACFLYTKISGNFTFSSRVGGSLVGYGDAVAVTVWHSSTCWAKLCLQRGKFGETQIVSVVTNSYSDEACGEQLRSADCSLRVTRRDNEFAMHFSKDRKKWRFVRSFVWVDCPAELYVGVHAQAPNTGTGQCSGEFYDFNLLREPVKDFHSGI